MNDQCNKIWTEELCVLQSTKKQTHFFTVHAHYKESTASMGYKIKFAPLTLFNSHFKNLIPTHPLHPNWVKFFCCFHPFTVTWNHTIRYSCLASRNQIMCKNTCGALFDEGSGVGGRGGESPPNGYTHTLPPT